MVTSLHAIRRGLVSSILHLNSQTTSSSLQALLLRRDDVGVMFLNAAEICFIKFHIYIHIYVRSTSMHAHVD
jgi:hypothetical protein